MIWDNLNVKWNGLQEWTIEVKNLKLVEILKIIWFEMCEVLLKFIQINYYWNLFKYECFQVKSNFDGKLCNWTIYNLDFWIKYDIWTELYNPIEMKKCYISLWMIWKV